MLYFIFLSTFCISLYSSAGCYMLLLQVVHALLETGICFFICATKNIAAGTEISIPFSYDYRNRYEQFEEFFHMMIMIYRQSVFLSTNNRSSSSSPVLISSYLLVLFSALRVNLVYFFFNKKSRCQPVELCCSVSG